MPLSVPLSVPLTVRPSMGPSGPWMPQAVGPSVPLSVPPPVSLSVPPSATRRYPLSVPHLPLAVLFRAFDIFSPVPLLAIHRRILSSVFESLAR